MNIIELARQAGGYDSPRYPENLVMDEHDLKRFAEIIAAREREACAKVCEDIYNDPEGNNGYDCYYTRPYLDCANEIRVRGNT